MAEGKTMEALIRRGGSVDCIRISELTREYFQYMPLNPDQIFDRMKKGVRYLVLGHEGRVKGYLDYEFAQSPDPRNATDGGPLPTEKTAKILGLCVEPDLRGNGYGKKLLAQALEEAKKEGCQQAVILVEEGNEKAIRLYAKFGFVQHGKLRQDLWGKRVLLCVKKL
ncbi:MAG TPA: GNAT family N-acetyltransferase [Candidatus Norongarragalinales archaeon]|nr:GNAT family N-acetyltransferase [Candidatus Norongarragalinales archaeon]